MKGRYRFRNKKNSDDNSIELANRQCRNPVIPSIKHGKVCGRDGLDTLLLRIKEKTTE
jgi:hypothetical protein